MAFKVEIKERQVIITGRPVFTSAAKAIALKKDPVTGKTVEDRRHVVPYANVLKPSCERIMTYALAKANQSPAEIIDILHKNYNTSLLSSSPSSSEGFERHVAYLITQLNSVVNNLNPGSNVENQASESFRSITDDLLRDINRILFSNARIESLLAKDEAHFSDLCTLVFDKINEKYEISGGTTARRIFIDTDKGIAVEVLTNIVENTSIPASERLDDCLRFLRNLEFSTATDIAPDRSGPLQTRFALHFSGLMKRMTAFENGVKAESRIKALLHFFHMPPIDANFDDSDVYLKKFLGKEPCEFCEALNKTIKESKEDRQPGRQPRSRFSNARSISRSRSRFASRSKHSSRRQGDTQPAPGN